MELGARLAAELPQRYSQREVARMMGVSRSAIQRSERLILAKVAKKLLEIAHANRS
jgi:DNA-directed RNA polymerase specialized sigma subunit